MIRQFWQSKLNSVFLRADASAFLQLLASKMMI